MAPNQGLSRIYPTVSWRRSSARARPGLSRQPGKCLVDQVQPCRYRRVSGDEIRSVVSSVDQRGENAGIGCHAASCFRQSFHLQLSAVNRLLFLLLQIGSGSAADRFEALSGPVEACDLPLHNCKRVNSPLFAVPVCKGSND